MGLRLVTFTSKPEDFVWRTQGMVEQLVQIQPSSAATVADQDIQHQCNN